MNCTCPYCGKKNYLNTPIHGDGSPKPDSISICIGCGEAAVFDDNLELKKMKNEQRTDLFTGHPDVWRTMQRVKEFILQRKAQMN